MKNDPGKAPEEKSGVAKREEGVLAFWHTNNVFKKSEEKPAPKGEYVFYDGPPFATGLPHYGHLLASTIKDAIPRYQSMRGHRVVRKWGWDCHGLPLENEIEKELGLTTKRDIESLGIAKFNEAARDAVLRYADDWKKIIPRMGRWVDMESDYKTMDTSYTESVWWVFKTLYDKKSIYQGFKSMHLCPRCGTTLSNFEVNQGYKDTTDISVYVGLKLKDEQDTSLIVWTTTPWTLPGNMAAAVNKDVEYVTVEKKDEGGLTRFIVAKDKLKDVFGDDEYTIVDTYKGEELIGKSYIPPFDYYKDKNIEHKENAWKVYHADYVSVEDGTGVVHLAPAFGEEDLVLAQQEDIPVVHHVTPEGVFAQEVSDFAGMFAKPKDDPLATDIEIIKALSARGALFKKQKVTHSYPFCWRCDTPLLNYATSSWFVRVTDFKDKLVSENKKVGWIPKDVGTHRFGNWLENARDWAISRSRYWGAPLPVWLNEKEEKVRVMGSVEDLKKYIASSGNTYFMMRHGEAVHNTKNTLNAKDSVENPVTEEGRKQVYEAAKLFNGKSIDLIIHSPLQRTRETAELLASELKLPGSQLREDARLTEVNVGLFEGKTIDEYHAFFADSRERMSKRPEGGENWGEVKRRVSEVLYELEREYKDKKILIISHNGPLEMIQAGALGYDVDQCGEAIKDNRFDMSVGEVRKLPFIPLPHNTLFELDLHRPYIDEITLIDTDGSELKRIPDVFDCWFESGSMPYGQQHYPFENTDVFEPKSGWFKRAKGYPADFIAEGMDQTRGWFYSLIVLGVGLFGHSPYKNVIVNGLVLAEDGRKMSKRLKNYPDPAYILNTYGADALRYYLLSSPIVRGEDLNFSEKGVDEVMKKLLVRLENVYSFYALYVEDGTVPQSVASKNILDQWILSRLNELTLEITGAMERYELDRATRPIGLFIDDLSTWYIRRSRERFKSNDVEDRAHALETTRTVLMGLSKVMAPFMPFYAEALYQELKKEDDLESVHLCEWPEAGKSNKEALEDMAVVRRLVSLGLEARAKAGTKVRQPLAELKVRSEKLKGKMKLLELIEDEVNVKKISFDTSLSEEVELDTELTDELRQEGLVRDLIRRIQQFRKENDLTPQEKVAIIIDTDEHLKEAFVGAKTEIMNATLLSDLTFGFVEGEKETVDGHPFAFSLSK
ncbi:MAG: class I tRNA ligase family protein [Candidatus Pacebacteria bacterium]|nr:class I tRNA ligase family protein [Candidatus Paceibacterota bacterium]